MKLPSFFRKKDAAEQPPRPKKNGMRLIDLLSLIVDNLGRRKGRVVLTAVGVVIGTAAVVVLVSLGAGLQKNATNSLWGINDLSTVDVYPGYPKAQGSTGTTKENDIKKLTPTAVERIKEISGVTRVIVKQQMNGSVEISYGRLQTWSSITGLDVSDLSEFGLKPSQGVTAIGKGEVVIGSAISRNFYNPHPKPGEKAPEPPDLMGQTLKFKLTRWTADGTPITKSYMFRVVGILAESRGEADYSIYLPYEEVTRWNEWNEGKRIDWNKRGYNSVVVKTTSPEVSVEVAKKISDMGFQAQTPQSTVQSINSFFTILQLVFGGVGAIALLVAAIGIANTMAMAIMERTREIGIMKAIGATNNNILSIFLGEAAGIGFIGGIGGTFLGWLVTLLINVLGGSMVSSNGGGTSLSASMPFWLPFFCVGFASMIGLLSGLYPSLNAATLVPVNALKYE